MKVTTKKPKPPPNVIVEMTYDEAKRFVDYWRSAAKHHREDQGRSDRDETYDLVLAMIDAGI